MSEEKKGTQSSEGNQEVADKKDRPWKNQAKEYERKLNQQKELNEKMANRLTQLEQSVKVDEQNKPDADEFRESLEELGYEKELAEKMQKQVEKISDYKANQKVKKVEKRIKPVEEQVYKTARSANLKELEKSDDMGVVSKYRDEIEAELDKYPAHTWGNKEAVEMAKSRVVDRHLSEILDEKAKKKESPTETSPGSSSPEGINVSDEAKQRAEAEGIDPEAAQRIINKRKKVLKKRNKGGNK